MTTAEEHEAVLRVIVDPIRELLHRGITDDDVLVGRVVGSIPEAMLKPALAFLIRRHVKYERGYMRRSATRHANRPLVKRTMEWVELVRFWQASQVPTAAGRKLLADCSRQEVADLRDARYAMARNLIAEGNRFHWLYLKMVELDVEYVRDLPPSAFVGILDADDATLLKELRLTFERTPFDDPVEMVAGARARAAHRKLAPGTRLPDVAEDDE